MNYLRNRGRGALGPALAAFAFALGSTIASAAEGNAVPGLADDPSWWKHAVIYEIYPRSFQDTNGDGVGDLQGITRRLDYLQGLGIDAIWIAPAYPSPQVDFGYDISDYRGVDPQYGSLADLDRLIAEAGRRGIRVLLDMVPNHTSDQHAWFRESASSRDNPRAGWYVWNDGIPAGTPGISRTQRNAEHEGRVPPNNWLSLFGGSAWEWVPARRQFYYHRFYRQQPDLDWRNPAVEQAMFDEMRFWLRRGVAGFRLDAITAIFEDRALRNSRETGGTNEQGDPNLDESYIDNLPEVHDVIRRLRRMVDAFPGQPILLGETWMPRIEELDRWYGGAAHDELHLAMDMQVAMRDEARFTAAHFRRVLRDAQEGLHGAQPLLVFDNHDKARSIDRFGDGLHDGEIARIVAAILYASRGTALTYYGAEIGMRTTPPTRREDVLDPIGITGWPAEKGRDGERTPMQWTPGPQAGFTTGGHPWLPVPASHDRINVETEDADPASLLSWTRSLIALRRSEPALRDGAMVFVDHEDEGVLAFLRTPAAEGKAGLPVLVAMNLTGQARSIAPDLAQSGLQGGELRVLVATDPGLKILRSPARFVLPPFSVLVAEISGIAK
jgi:alpha-glucosidase